MILVIIAAWLGYKRASANGRNGGLWALVTATAFLGAQILVGVGAGMFIAFGIAAWEWPETTFEDSLILINVVAVIASFLVVWPILRWLDKPAITADETFTEPPPPPQF
jgi:MFS family permease